MGIDAISPLDGRYYEKVKIISEYFSEKALIKYRVFCEIKYFIKLIDSLNIRKITDQEQYLLKNLLILEDNDIDIIKQIETKGYEDILATNHDVKAIEYYIKKKIENTSLKDLKEYIHFGLTSEDINNISYGLMIRDCINNVLFQELINLYDNLYNFAYNNKNVPMLSRTHGQPATPSTFGKEILVFVSRLKEEFKLLFNIPILVKLNGATGNFNAHNFVYPYIDWDQFSNDFIDSLNLEFRVDSKYYNSGPIIIKQNKITTQIEPHDSYCRIFDCFKRINTILIDFCQDMWRYISDGWIKQKVIKGEIGSSAMPHKVNPIDFENGEGNLGLANALFNFFTQKLMISRLQRDLSDSTVLRNIGVAFAHSLLSYKSILKGLSKIELNYELIKKVLNDNIEVITEAIQNLLRANNVDNPYEKLKELTRGKKISKEDLANFINNLNIDDNLKQKLYNLNPENYIGLAEKIVIDFNPKIN